MKSAWVALALASLAYAQNTTSSAVPSGLTDRCTTFLNQLNSNTPISTCLNEIIEATGDIGSGANQAAITGVLDRICAPSFNSCSASTIRGQLVNFYTECETDMAGASGNGSDGRKDVLNLYDYLYLIIPLKDSMCTKDGADYCVNKLNSGTTPSSASSSASAPAASQPAKRSFNLLPRQEQTNSTTGQLTLGPDSEEYNESGLPYLFVTTESDQSQLCSTCTSEILTKYVSFESITPYALGIANSPILGGQVELWQKFKTCPGNLANQVVANAANQTMTSGALEDARVSGGATMLAAIAAALFGAVALF